MIPSSEKLCADAPRLLAALLEAYAPRARETLAAEPRSHMHCAVLEAIDLLDAHR